MNETENDVLQAVCEYLAYKQIFFWRVNQVPVWNNDAQAFRRMPKWSRRGVPDIIAVINGRFIGIECKTKKGKQSDGQVQFQQDLEKAGGVYWVVRGIDSITPLLASICAIEIVIHVY